MVRSRFIADLFSGSTKDQNEIVKEISALLRQITGSVSCLPLLDCPCAFDLLVYTNKDSSTPVRWEEAAPHYIPNSVEVKLRSFSTKVIIGPMLLLTLSDSQSRFSGCLQDGPLEKLFQFCT